MQVGPIRRVRKELETSRHFPLDRDGVRRSEDGSTAEEIDDAPPLSECEAEKIAMTSKASFSDFSGYAWRLEFDGPEDSPYEGARLALLVRFTTRYPMAILSRIDSEIMVSDFQLKVASFLSVNR
jgi:hypothetical protein